MSHPGHWVMVLYLPMLCIIGNHPCIIFILRTKSAHFVLRRNLPMSCQLPIDQVHGFIIPVMSISAIDRSMGPRFALWI